MTSTRRFSAAVAVSIFMLLTVFEARAQKTGAKNTAPVSSGTQLITSETPWRVFLVCRNRDKRGKKPTIYTPLPPASWVQPDFDDSNWGRYGTHLASAIGGYGCEQSAENRLLCLRTRFGIADPARARDITLTLEYRGGIAVHVNGKEVARQHLPKGPLEPLTEGDAYPEAAFKDADGTPLRRMKTRPADKHRDRYEARIRKLSVTLPSAALRKGANVLTIELHATDLGSMKTDGKDTWSTAGLCSVRLASRSGAGVIPYSEALKKLTAWNASPMETIPIKPGKYQSGFLWWGISVTPVDLTRANVFDALGPIRTVAPRGGTCSGQVVVSGPEGFAGLKASIGPLKHVKTGKTLPAESVAVRYAKQDKHEMYCNALLPGPVDGAPVQPVWVLVDVPRDQPSGWYTGELALEHGGASLARVPVQVLVAGWTVTDPRNNATLISLYQSPDTLAEYYKADYWSDRHFELIEHSMKVGAKTGNDVLLVPVIVDTYLKHKHGLVRWVRNGGRLEPEFSAFERYLDLHIKAFGKPKVVTLSIWKSQFGCRTWFRGRNSNTVDPCMVTELDPSTGAMKPVEAPHFGQPGSEEFWRTMIEGVRRILKSRGCSDEFFLLGEPFDSRPLQPVVDFFKKIEPTMRWQIYSHFDGGEPKPQNGKFISHGGFEVGFRINPNNGCLPEFDRNWPKVSTNEFLIAQVQRVQVHYTSSPLSYRSLMHTSGSLARTGIDFWHIAEERGRLRSYYGCPPNEGWLWRGHVPNITGPGPNGAVITTRGQMLIEGLQESEAVIVLRRARQGATPEIAKRIDRCRGRRGQASRAANGLSQATLGLDWLGIAAQEFALAGELAGTPGDGDWASPPDTGGRK